MFFINPPDDFDHSLEIVSCFVEKDDCFLLLHRQDHKPQGNTWGVPAGKIEKNEDPTIAILRELEEESGLLFSSSDLEYLTKVYVRYPEFDYVYHIFKTQLKTDSVIIINNNSHKNYCWITPSESLKMPLIPEQDKCIKLCYGL